MTLTGPLTPDPDAAADAAEVARGAVLHRQLRAWILATWPDEPTQIVASALMYEVISLIACVAESDDEAETMLACFHGDARAQLAAFGVGRPHP